MKKSLIFVMVAAVAMLTAACNGCSKNKSNDLTYPVVGVDVNKTWVDDLAYMGFHYENYEWMESCIDMADFINEADTCNVLAVANIFKVVYVDTVTGGIKPIAVLIAHTADTTVYEVKDGLWVGDNDMREYYKPFEVDFANAWNKMTEANCIKPHSRHCVLRKEVGPNDCNPLYIFGNQTSQVYVDVVTGKVNTENPVFKGFDDSLFAEPIDTTYTGTVYGPRNTRIGCPLGEWP